MSRSRQKILLFAGDDFEDMELMYPRYRLEEAGFIPVIAGLKGGHVYTGKYGYPAASDTAIADVHAIEFSGVICPGGWMPDKLRREARVQQLLQEFHAAQKLVAAICHGGWLCISAGIYSGVRVTGSPGIKDDLRNAGALYQDAPCVVDRHFVSSRKPDDLPAFMQACLAFLAAHPPA